MALWGALLVFSVFALNVVLGSAGRVAFLGDVGEMLTLAAASILFVMAILKREAEARETAHRERQSGRTTP